MKAPLTIQMGTCPPPPHSIKTQTLNMPTSCPIYPKSTTVIVMLAKQGLCYLATPVSRGQHVGDCVRPHSVGSFSEKSAHWPLS